MKELKDFVKRVLVINALGKDGGGSWTLGREFKNLGTHFLYIDKNQDDKHAVKDCNRIFEYVKENKDEISHIVLNVYQEPSNKAKKKIIPQLIKIREQFLNIPITFLDCARNSNIARDFMADYTTEYTPVDRVFRLADIAIPFYEGKIEHTLVDINVFDWDRHEQPITEKSKRSNNVITTGRVEAFKGIGRFITDGSPIVIEKCPQVNLVHYGAKFTIAKTSGKVSGSPGLITKVCNSLYDKTPRPHIEVNPNYDVPPTSGKYTVYPSYRSFEDIKNRLSTALCGIAPHQACITQKHISLKHEKLWVKGIEYAVLEILALGTPVMFSEKYCETANIQNPKELTYKDWGDLAHKINTLNQMTDEEYLKAAQAQRDFIKHHQEIVNTTFFKLLLNKGERKQ